MTFDFATLFGIAVAYLLLLFLVAYSVERQWIPRQVARHPATYVLSLGVYATTWSFYGSVGFAKAQGFSFLAIYLGVTLAFVLTPLLLSPILRLVREHQLTSVADLFTFRFRSQFAGFLVTLFMLVGTLPYIALQIRAVTESVRILTGSAESPATLALGFCLTLILFSILFGARHISPREKHEGLVVAIAFESLIKLLAMLTVGGFAVFGVFGGFGDMQDWLTRHPQAMEALYRPVREGPWGTLLLLSFAAAFLLPRQFHMTFTENIDPRTLSYASWAFPLFLLLLNLAIPPLLWAGTHLQVATSADYYTVGVPLGSGSPALAILAYVGGISSASAMVIVTSLALAAMCLNHMLLPASYPDPQVDVYRWVLWARRMIIGIVIMAGFFFFIALEQNQGLVQLGLISFVAVAQFLPGVVGVLFWRGANRTGFIAGLLGGAGVWFATLMLPLFEAAGFVQTEFNLQTYLGAGNIDKWGFATFWSLSVNAFLFGAVSLFTRQSEEEREAAAICVRESVAPPAGEVGIRSPEQAIELLTASLGGSAARREVDQARNDLGMAADEGRPAELRRLRDRIERNLSGLLGPQLAHVIVDARLSLNRESRSALADSVRFMEDRLERSRTRLRGLAAELDALRRYHRQVLQDLPIGVCAVSPEIKVVLWNQAMVELSGVEASPVIGGALGALSAPWDTVLAEFVAGDRRHIPRQVLVVNGHERWFSLHKAAIEDPAQAPDAAGSGLVVLVEDLTEIRVLEDELIHSERLASIGRLAAGVAHEIGNPLTGIASLAQNLRGEEDPSLMQEGVEQILEQSRRISEIVQSLLSFSRAGASEAERRPVSLKDVVDEAIRLVTLSHSGKQMDFRNQCPLEFRITGHEARLIQVFVNLLSNAVDASGPGDTVRVSACHEGAEGIRVDVEDSGTGIPPDLQERVFEPFFTTKQPGEGTGLGMPLAYNIVRDHRGHMVVHSESGRGTRVSVHFQL